MTAPGEGETCPGELVEFGIPGVAGLMPLLGVPVVPVPFVPGVVEFGDVVVGEVGSVGEPLDGDTPVAGTVVSPAFGAGVLELGFALSTPPRVDADPRLDRDPREPEPVVEPGDPEPDVEEPFPAPVEEPLPADVPEV